MDGKLILPIIFCVLKSVKYLGEYRVVDFPPLSYPCIPGSDHTIYYFLLRHFITISNHGSGLVFIKTFRKIKII